MPELVTLVRLNQTDWPGSRMDEFTARLSAAADDTHLALSHPHDEFLQRHTSTALFALRVPGATLHA